jgi:hypothetical protein
MPVLTEQQKSAWKDEAIGLAEEDLSADRQPDNEDWINRFVAWLGENDWDLRLFANQELEDIMKFVTKPDLQSQEDLWRWFSGQREKLTLFAALKQLGKDDTIDRHPAEAVSEASKAVSDAYEGGAYNPSNAPASEHHEPPPEPPHEVKAAP